jgi:hypothetical protein
MDHREGAFTHSTSMSDIGIALPMHHSARNVREWRQNAQQESFEQTPPEVAVSLQEPAAPLSQSQQCLSQVRPPTHPLVTSPPLWYPR